MSRVDPKTLQRELETYKKNRENLVAEHLGEWVLIFEDEVIDTYETKGEGLKRAYEKYGINTPFMLREIVETEIPKVF